MNNKKNKYSSDDVLQILKDFYNFQSYFDPEVEKNEEITFELTILKWRQICDLNEVKSLAQAYYNLFKIKTDFVRFEALLSREREKTLKDFCDYISDHAIREEIQPVMSLGHVCESAGIFKAVRNKLGLRGIDMKNFRPSAEFSTFFNQKPSETLEVISLMAPGTISSYKNKENRQLKIGLYSFGGLIFLLSLFAIAKGVLIFLVIPLLMTGLFLYLVFNRKNNYEIADILTVRDLIVQMKSKMY